MLSQEILSLYLFQFPSYYLQTECYLISLSLNVEIILKDQHYVDAIQYSY